MEFFGMGAGEIFLILVIALIIFGPARIVEIGRDLGKMIYNLRKATSDLTTRVTREIEEEKNQPTPPSGNEQPSKS